VAGPPFFYRKKKMNIDNLKDLILQHVKARSDKVSVLKFLAGEYERLNYSNSVTVEQIVRKAIDNNNTCLAAREDENLKIENDFLKTLLPNYLSVAELKSAVGHLNLDSTGASVGKAIKYLKSNGLAFLPEDVKKALE
jgi:hypothetical protein